MLSGLFAALDTKVRDSFNAFKSTIEDLFSAEAADVLSSTWSDAYDDAVVAGPLPNQLTGPGATLMNAHQDFMSQWQSSDSYLSVQPIPSALGVCPLTSGRLEIKMKLR